MKQISKKELVEILKNSTATTIVLNTETEVKMNKRGNPLAKEKVTKVTEGEFEFGDKSYNERVNESIDSSLGYVQTKSLPWGKWVEGAEGKVIINEKVGKDGETISNLYLRYYNAVGELGVTVYINGSEATSEDLATIAEFSPKKKVDSSTYTTDSGNIVESTVRTNVVSFDNIKSIVVDGETYTL